MEHDVYKIYLVSLMIVSMIHMITGISSYDMYFILYQYNKKLYAISPTRNEDL